MADTTNKITIADLLGSKQEEVERARTAIELAESFPVKGGDIVPKKGGGWFEIVKIQKHLTRPVHEGWIKILRLDKGADIG